MFCLRAIIIGTVSILRKINLYMFSKFIRAQIQIFNSVIFFVANSTGGTGMPTQIDDELHTHTHAPLIRYVD